MKNNVICISCKFLTGSLAKTYLPQRRCFGILSWFFLDSDGIFVDLSKSLLSQKLFPLMVYKSTSLQKYIYKSLHLSKNDSYTKSRIQLNSELQNLTCLSIYNTFITIIFSMFAQYFSLIFALFLLILTITIQEKHI